MAKVEPIPEGFHSLTPHIVVRGAVQAIEFYKKAFGAVEIRRAPMPDGKTLMHADLKIGDSHLMLVDEMPGMGSHAPREGGGTPVTLHLFVEDVDAVMKRAEAAGAKVTKPPMDMFWGDRYGALTDPFGHDWSVATHKEDVTPEEMKKRGDAMFAEMAKGKP
ncbi:MAG: VOC family protein [Gemmataceae bacterium]